MGLAGFLNLLKPVVCGCLFWVCGWVFANGFVGFADGICGFVGLWVLLVVDGHGVCGICWVSGQAFFCLLFVLLRKLLFFNFFFRERRDVTGVTSCLRIRTEMGSF